MREVPNKVNFPEVEKTILEYWKTNTIFQKSVEQYPKEKEFVFYDGPPFATGLPHYGHLLAGTIKDVIPRYQTMKGHRVERRFGWDCHGLPVEYEIEQHLNLGGKHEIEKFGVGNFNEECRSVVLRYTNEWRAIVQRMGRWIDFDNDYKTMDLPFMESVWQVFKRLWDQGLIYQGVKVVPYSWRVSTPLSNFEANLNYKEVQDPSITIQMKSTEEENTYFLAWTTTPWTLPANLALCVGPQLLYVKIKVKQTGEQYYLAKNRLSTYFEEDQYEWIGEYFGKELGGKKYYPLFDFAQGKVDVGNAWQVLVDEYVSDSDGTGIVHQAPAFGEDDLRVSQNADIAVFDPVDAEGNFISNMDFLAGMNIKEADKVIIRKLKEEKKLFKQETIQHNYPFCWRTDTPLIYKAISTWFVNVEAIKDKMVRNNQTVHWVPHHMRDGRFGKWLENARDWAISRNRFWGTPLPIWKSDDGDILCLGSVAELETAVGQKIDDIHKHLIDDLTIEKEGITYRRIPEVLDCWFESGSMPYAQQHYPFENKEKFESNFPADFICEGLDQTRGWFYTLMVISSALFDKPAFGNVIVNGLILAEDGKKMSKRLKNYPDPIAMLDQYGADAIRLYMLNSPAMRGEDLKFTERGLIEITRAVLLPLWNVLSFFTTYAVIDQWEPTTENLNTPASHPLDRWVLSCLQKLVKEVSTGLDAYDLNQSVSPFVAFIDLLTNWYIRRSRRRFWKSEYADDKQQAYATLYRVLIELSKVIAPFIPFIADAIYQELKTDQHRESVHLDLFPVYQEALRDENLEQQMDLVLSCVNMGRSLRNKYQLKIRQPLQKITLVSKNITVQNVLSDMVDLIKDELNVKEVLLTDNEEELVDYRLKANFKVLGPKLGKQMKRVAQEIEKLGQESIQSLLEKNAVHITIDQSEYTIAPEDVFIQRIEKSGLLVLTENDVTVALDPEVTEALKMEGFSREFINKVQNMRKEHGLEVVDRIAIAYDGTTELQKALMQFEKLICNETLALSLHQKKIENDGEVWDVNGQNCSIVIEKVA